MVKIILNKKQEEIVKEKKILEDDFRCKCRILKMNYHLNEEVYPHLKENGPEREDMWMKSCTTVNCKSVPFAFWAKFKFRNQV